MRQSRRMGSSAVSRSRPPASASTCPRSAGLPRTAAPPRARSPPRPTCGSSPEAPRQHPQLVSLNVELEQRPVSRRDIEPLLVEAAPPAPLGFVARRPPGTAPSSRPATGRADAKFSVSPSGSSPSASERASPRPPSDRRPPRAGPARRARPGRLEGDDPAAVAVLPELLGVQAPVAPASSTSSTRLSATAVRDAGRRAAAG